jgi:hypothetical protein
MPLLLPALASSVCEVILTQPLDVIKIKYQTGQPIRYNFPTLYAGFLPRALGNIPSRSIFLISQENLKKYVGPTGSLSAFFLVPIGTGFAQTLVDTPVEILKMNRIMRLEHRFLYKGFIPHLGRNILFLLPVYNFREYANGSPVAGAIGGLVGSYLSHPLDTLKTFRQTGQAGRPSNYFKGCHIRAGMSMINMYISFTIFMFVQ